jgi:hypothetical protein
MRVRPAARVSLLGLAALVGVFVASPAEAFQAPPVPVAVPGSVVGSLDNATAVERARMVGNTIPGSKFSVPASAGKVVTKGVGGPVMMGVSAFFLGFDGANAVMRAAGVDDVGLEALFPPKPDPNYTPNYDTPPTQYPGWSPDPFATNGLAQSGVDADKISFDGYFTFTEGPAVRAGSTGTVVLLSKMTKGVTRWAGTTDNSSAVFQESMSIQVYCRQTATGSVQAANGYGGPSVSRPPPANPTGYPQTRELVTDVTVNAACGTGWFLDHVEMQARVGPGSATKVFGKWWPVGNANRPALSDGNPARYWQTRWTCSGGAAKTADSAQFKETDASWPKWPDATCPRPQTVGHTEYWQIVPTLPEHTVKVSEWDPTSAATDWVNTYPQCVQGACRLELYRVDGGDKLACFQHPSACTDWMDLPAADRDARFRCEYAGAVVPLSECYVYGPTFNIAAGTAVKDAAGNVLTNPEPYGDPKTGEPQPKPGPAPGPGTEPESGKCPPPFSMTLGGFGYWVFQGTVCALQAAFVPSPEALSSAQDTIVAKWSGTAPAVAIGAVGGIVGAFGDWSTTGSCMGPEVAFDLVGQHIAMHPFQACAGVMQTMADFTRWGGTAIVWFAALLSSSRVLAMSFGMSLPWDGSEVTGGD